MEFQKIKFVYFTLLHSACQSKNLNIVKYIKSFDKIDIASKTISLYLIFLIKFHSSFVLLYFKLKNYL